MAARELVHAGDLIKDKTWYRTFCGVETPVADVSRKSMSGVPTCSACLLEYRARGCGLTADQWTKAKGQASSARSRGRRPAERAQVKLETWGQVDGQESLFDTGKVR
jgi:hypothetical protein